MRTWLTDTIFAVALALASLHCFHRFLGTSAMLLYAALGTPVLVLILHWLVRPIAWGLLPGRAAFLADWATLIFCVGAYVGLNALANSGRIGPGSDSDDALNVAASALLKGEYPYYQRTYRGNKLTPMPGAILLAAPFYAIGNSSYQNIFWVIVLFWLLRREFAQPGATGALLAVVFLGSPEFLREHVTGGDLITNTTYVLAALWLLLWQTRDGKCNIWGYAAATALGITLASRPNFGLLLPVVFGSLVARVGWARAIAAAVTCCAAGAAITLPFYFYDPAGFAPLHVSSFLKKADQCIPHFSAAAGTATALASLALGAWLARAGARHRTDVPVYLSAAATQAIPIISGGLVILLGAPLPQGADVSQQSPGLVILSYGTTWGIFAAVAWAGSVARRAQIGHLSAVPPTIARAST